MLNMLLKPHIHHECIQYNWFTPTRYFFSTLSELVPFRTFPPGGKKFGFSERKEYHNGRHETVRNVSFKQIDIQIFALDVNLLSLNTTLYTIYYLKRCIQTEENSSFRILWNDDTIL